MEKKAKGREGGRKGEGVCAGGGGKGAHITLLNPHKDIQPENSSS